jgi:hypothetical protein
MSATKSKPIDPKDLTALAAGIGLAILLMVGFYFLSAAMGQDTFVRHAAIPHQ